MATDPLAERLARLRELIDRLDARDEAGDDPAERLARALLDRPAPRPTHDEVLEALPGYLEARLRGAPLTAEHKSIKRHLAACGECGAIYALMLEHEEALASAPSPAPLPEPDFAALPGRLRPVSLRTLVTALAGDLLRILHPKELPDLAYLAEGFFDSLRMLPPGARLEPELAAVLGAGGKGKVEPSVVTRYLAAALVATQALRERVGAGQFEALAAGGRLEPVARPIAETAGAQAGLDRKEAGRFADEYVRRLLAAPADFENVTPDL